MARPRSNKLQNKGRGTAFGKQSDAEKSFRKRKRISRDDDFKSAPRPGGNSDRQKRTGPSDFRRNESGPGTRESFGKAPFRKSPGNFRPVDKPDYRESRSKPGSRPDQGDSREKKPFRKSGSERPGPDGHRGDQDRSRNYSSHSRSEGPAQFKRSSRPKYSADGEREKKPFRKSRPAPDVRAPDRHRENRDHSFPPRSPGPPSFTKKPRTRSDSDSDSQRDKKDDREQKPLRKSEQKSFVQSRVIKSGDFVKVVRTEAPKKDDGLTRLNKYIANSGVGSRREADELIKMGLIKEKGIAITELGTKVKQGDEVRYEDRVLKAEKPVYILLNKPKGFITTTDDPQERNTVMGLVAGACKERIYPVGRLDRNTTGLLLLTNDGDLADKLTHPSYQAKKVYKAELDKPLTKNDFQKVMDGVQFEEGRAMVDDLAIISDDHKTVGLEIHIGWNRVVRRIFEALGYEVGKLDRSVFAGLDKKDLSRGQWRFLKPEEVVRLKHFQ